jgi:hypothetical protein
MRILKKYTMEDEKPLTGEESLALITRMINKAKCDYEETGISALMWGSVITFCSIVSFVAYEINVHVLNYVWYLIFAAVVPQIIIAVKQRRRKQYTSYAEDFMGGIWISFGIALLLFTIYNGRVHPPLADIIFLIMYGVPTFATGFSRRFTPMVVGGIVCWVLAIAGLYTDYQYRMLYSAIAAQCAWFIPGLILRRRYMKAKAGNV